MSDLAVLFCLISLCVGVASISISIFMNHTYKKYLFNLFIGLIFSLFLIQSSIMLIFYADCIAHPSRYIYVLSKILDASGTSLSSFFGLLFLHSLFGKELSKAKKCIIPAISVFQFIAIIICRTLHLSFLEYVVRASILFIICYEVYITAVNYKKIGNRELKLAVNTFAIISAIFIPLFLFESIRSYIPSLQDKIIIKAFSLPLFFLILNAFFLIFAYRYLIVPDYIENDRLTSFFINKYSITVQETNIIELLLIGLTYKQIADKLYISGKTVDNHVQNIYKKLHVTNKIQLYNLVHSKR